MASVSPKPTTFTDRCKPRAIQHDQQASAPQVIEAENHFPFASIDYLRVGSAHAVCEPEQDDEHIELLLRITSHLMSRYEPDLLPAKVTVENKSDLQASQADTGGFTRIADTGAVSTADKLIEPSFVERRWLKGLYLCVLVRGQLPGGARGYAYFGIFADTLIDFINRHQPHHPFNPNQMKAIVLARTTGAPSPEIREFMRMKFSFDDEVAILEISRSA